MPSLLSFRIEFEREEATYWPGEVVRGSVIFEIMRPKRVRGVKLTMRGLAYVYFARGKHKFSGKEIYFSTTQYLLGHRGGIADIDIPRGRHIYPFSFELPENLPCSFEHPIGHIRYTTKAAVDRPWKFDHEVKRAFTVVKLLNLNDYVERCIEIQRQIEQQYYKFCCLVAGELTACIASPFSGYVPGQPLTVKITFSVTSESPNLRKITARLEQKMYFHSQTPAKRTFIAKHDLLKTKNTGPFDRSGEVNFEFTVPSVPPSNLENCNLIDLDYRLIIVFYVSGFHRKLTKKFPIVIGTHPLILTPGTPSAHRFYTFFPSASPVPNEPDHSTPLVQMPSRNYTEPSASYSGATFSNSRPTSMGFRAGTSNRLSRLWETPPPSYEECMARAESIMDEDDSSYVLGADRSFAPRYPVFNFNKIQSPDM